MSWTVTEAGGHELSFGTEQEIMEHYGKGTMEDCLACAAGYVDFEDMQAGVPRLQGLSREDAIESLEDIWWLNGIITKED